MTEKARILVIEESAVIVSMVTAMPEHEGRMGRPYRIIFMPDPVCRSEAPESLVSPKNRQVRRQRGPGGARPVPSRAGGG